MAKVENKPKYARVMHHIGGLTGKNDNSDMIRGGEDELNLVTSDQFGDMSDADVERLFTLGALRAATPDEISQWEKAQGISDGTDTSFVFRTTGNENLKGQPGAVEHGAGSSEAGTDAALQQAKSPDELALAAQQQGTGGTGSTGHSEVGAAGTYKGMGKGELSEYSVPELKDFAKAEGVEGYSAMLKPELLDTLLNLGKKPVETEETDEK